MQEKGNQKDPNDVKSGKYFISLGSLFQYFQFGRIGKLKIDGRKVFFCSFLKNASILPNKVSTSSLPQQYTPHPLSFISTLMNIVNGQNT